MGFSEQISSGSPSTFREASRRSPPSVLSSLSIVVPQHCRTSVTDPLPSEERVFCLNQFHNFVDADGRVLPLLAEDEFRHIGFPEPGSWRVFSRRLVFALRRPAKQPYSRLASSKQVDAQCRVSPIHTEFSHRQEGRLAAYGKRLRVPLADRSCRCSVYPGGCSSETRYLNRTVSGTRSLHITGPRPARPIPNWRSKPSAVAPVERPRLGLVGYRPA